MGLSGGKNSRELRIKLQKSLGLPSIMSASSLIEVLNTMMNSAELSLRAASLKEECDDI